MFIKKTLFNPLGKPFNFGLFEGFTTQQSCIEVEVFLKRPRNKGLGAT